MEMDESFSEKIVMTEMLRPTTDVPARVRWKRVGFVPQLDLLALPFVEMVSSKAEKDVMTETKYPEMVAQTLVWLNLDMLVLLPVALVSEFPPTAAMAPSKNLKKIVMTATAPPTMVVVLLVPLKQDGDASENQARVTKYAETPESSEERLVMTEMTELETDVLLLVSLKKDGCVPLLVLLVSPFVGMASS